MNIALELLEAHPGNANRVPAAVLRKLKRHIQASGRYPPLIVRRHPHDAQRYQIIDGHHRAMVLRELGHDSADCAVWPVDDRQAAMLLLTLNRLHGEDDPALRGRLLESLAADATIAELARLLPDDSDRIERLIQCSHPPPPPRPPMALDDFPQAVTFFLTQPQRARLFERLEAVARDRSQALIALLNLDGAAQTGHETGSPSC